MRHELKIYPEYFEHVMNGTKTFEYRHNDRNFKAGDMVRLREWQPSKPVTGGQSSIYNRVIAGRYTGSFRTFFIGYVFEIPDTEYCVFSLVRGYNDG